KRPRITIGYLLEQEQTTVETNPYDVDEVPVVADTLEHRQLPGVTGGTSHASEEEHHGDQAQEDVEAVEAGHDEEQGSVGVGAGAGQLGGPLVGLVAEEHHPEGDGGADPDAGATAVEPLLV